MMLNADDLIIQALHEDIPHGDITTNSIIRNAVAGEVNLVCKQDGIIAGLGVFERVFKLLDKNATFESACKDGDVVHEGEIIGTVLADVRVLLSGERTALNFLQRMSGVATYTHRMVELLDGTGIKLVDTRKTTPNLRIFEKYAVTVGGGHNHRHNLSDGVLIKDNHICAAGGIHRAVALVKEHASFVRKVEVEVETIEMVQEALDAGADIIMLDNMSPEMMAESVDLISGRAETECSGNVTKERVAELKNIGIDYISSGALTHSSAIIDFSLKNLRFV
ncbi:MAG: carboxylating nicotinate-nucleotide diphosphorylase [Actinobacteria bacterium]|nr:carboxylating nicotinate-nucleotide diphosphorylase [Actinomycetota bacterium]